MKDMTGKYNEFMGKEAKDKVTGFTGIITGRTQWLYGCDQYCITPKVKDEKMGDTSWFDEGRIEIIGSGINPDEVQVEKNGCDSAMPVNSRR